METALNITPNIALRNDLPPVAPQATPEEQSWLTRSMYRGRSERFTETVMITPGLAAAMLVYNLGNRPIVRAQVQRHVVRLQRGEFILHHHGIAFAKTGVLNDGQHRLKGIVESGIAGLMQVTFGAEREEFGVIDQGKSRTAAHLLAIMGENNYALRASIAKAIYQFDTKDTNPDLQLVVERALALRGDQMNEAISFAQSMVKVCAPTPCGVAHYVIATKTKRPNKLAEFFAGLASGEGLSGAKLKLREWLLKGVVFIDGGQYRSAQQSAAIVHAWNAHVTGRKTFSTTWRHVFTHPEPL